MNALTVATLHRFDALHASMKEVITALPAQALDWSPAPEVNSVAVLVAHVCGSERFWIGEKIGELDAQRDRDAEFTVRGLDHARLTAMLDASLGMMQPVLEKLTLDEMSRPASAPVSRDGSAHDVAWCLQHALEHVAVHTGHVELMRQWWKSQP
ncbi:MAG: DUF1572 family protein [Caldilineaceae bacterium]|jgi:uncharacterized damage-inducible protein DinB|nr:DUF1572 family protein [Caldilineaceae bacterium]